MRPRASLCHQGLQNSEEASTHSGQASICDTPYPSSQSLLSLPPRLPQHLALPQLSRDLSVSLSPWEGAQRRPCC